MHAGRPRGGGLIGSENLNETGKQFIEMLQRRPDWQTEWAEMNEHGAPLPNEMVVMSSLGSGLTFCFVPVVDSTNGKKVTRMIVAPIVVDTIAVVADSVATAPRLGRPYVFDEETVDRNSVARSFVGLDIIKNWRDRGLVFDAKVTLREPQMVSTRGMTYYESIFTINVIYALTGAGNVTLPSVSSYVRQSGLINGFLYRDKEFKGLFFERPTYSMYGEYSVYAYCALPINISLEFEDYANRLKNHIWRGICAEFWWCMYDERNVMVTCTYQWGSAHDADYWEDWYVGSGILPVLEPEKGGAIYDDLPPMPIMDGLQNVEEMENTDFQKDKPRQAIADCNGVDTHKTKTNTVSDIFTSLQEIIYCPIGATEVAIFPGYQDFVSEVNRQPSIEHSLVMTHTDDDLTEIPELNVNSGYFGDIAGVQHGSKDTVTIKSHPSMVATIHNHPATGAPTPSALDLILTVREAVRSPKFDGSYILADNGDMYCIKVTMTDAQRRTLRKQKISQNYEAFKSEVIDANNGFKKGTAESKMSEAALSQFSKLEANDRACHTLSYIAEKNGWGVVIMRKKKGETKFSSRHVVKDANGHYVPADCK